MNNKSVVTGCAGLPNSMEPALDIVKSLLLRKGDVLGLDYIKYRSVVREVHMDLNLHIVRRTRRFFLPVNKMTNTVDLPDTTLMFASVAVFDGCGKMHYLTRNDNLLYDVVAVDGVDDCGCDACSGNGRICYEVKSYEPIIERIEAPLPNGTKKTFECITRKRLDLDGTLWSERQFVVAKYGMENGAAAPQYLPITLPYNFDALVNQIANHVWLDTVVQTETTRECNFIVEKCGCVKECPENRRLLSEICCAETWEDECGHCRIPVHEYNITQDGGKLILPPGFAYDKVLVRVYEDNAIEDLLVPLYAKRAFLYGLATEVSLFDDSENQYRIEKYEQRYNREKSRLLGLLTRWTVKGMYSVLAPKIKML